MIDRKKQPVPLGDALDAWLTRRGFTKRLDQASVVEAWEELVGPQIAAVTRALSVTPDGTLMVRVASHGWATELGLMTPRILARVNGSRVHRVLHIRWMVGALDQS
ncbi:MAG: DUF721 domain-containing protein [Gemmatimonadales bacterium]